MNIIITSIEVNSDLQADKFDFGNEIVEGAKVLQASIKMNVVFDGSFEELENMSYAERNLAIASKLIAKTITI